MVAITMSDSTNAKDPHDIFHSVRALDTGISNHESWVSQVHQSLICNRIHPNPDDLCDDAHCRCKFGKWLYSSTTDKLKGLESHQLVVDNHEKMHALARNILQKNENNQAINEDEYRDFTAQAMLFKLDVRNLQYALMSEVCVIDHLTGAWNRNAMHSKLNQEKERLLRTGRSSSVCMMDFDHFKLINDNYGHIAGDKVLKSVIQFCRDNLRTYDSIYRYGGEEFLFFLPDAEMDESCAVIERLCAILREHSIFLDNGTSLSITASFGIASMTKDVTVDETIQAADNALLCAKANGRDRVCCWDEGLSDF